MVWTRSPASCLSQSLSSLKDRARPPAVGEGKTHVPPGWALLPKWVPNPSASPVCLSPFLAHPPGLYTASNG